MVVLTFIVCCACLVSLALDAEVHDVVPARGMGGVGHRGRHRQSRVRIATTYLQMAQLSTTMSEGTRQVCESSQCQLQLWTPSTGWLMAPPSSPTRTNPMPTAPQRSTTHVEACVSSAQSCLHARLVRTFLTSKRFGWLFVVSTSMSDRASERWREGTGWRSANVGSGWLSQEGGSAEQGKCLPAMLYEGRDGRV